VIPLRYSPTWCAWISSRCLLHNMRWSIAPRFAPRACWNALQQVLFLYPHPPIRIPCRKGTEFGISSSVSRRRASICRWSPTHGKEETDASEKGRHWTTAARHNPRRLTPRGSEVGARHCDPLLHSTPECQNREQRAASRGILNQDEQHGNGNRRRRGSFSAGSLQHSYLARDADPDRSQRHGPA
jgi:hypothetical protein